MTLHPRYIQSPRPSTLATFLPVASALPVFPLNAHVPRDAGGGGDINTSSQPHRYIQDGLKSSSHVVEERGDDGIIKLSVEIKSMTPLRDPC